MIFTPLLFFFETHFHRISPKAYEKNLSICKNIQTAAGVQPSFVIKKGTTFSAVPIDCIICFILCCDHRA